MTPSELLDEAFAATPRTEFLPRSERRFAAADRALPIGWEQTNSQPTTVRAMLALLDVRPGQRVLDVGSGSGWTTALLGHLVGPDGSVVGVEVVPELVELGRGNLARVDRPNATIRPALEGVLGLPGAAPYDRILVSAGADAMPDRLTEQLAEGGVMVVPVGGVMHEVRRTADGLQDRTHGRYSFVPLVT